MFRILSCLEDQHDWRLVVLAGVVCFAASLVAITIFHRAIACQRRTRLIWIAIAGGAIGYGIWATHFIAMLAYEPGVPTGYAVSLTGLSLIAAMVLTSIGLGLAASQPAGWRPAIGGGIIGAGIASMHYFGMWALQVPGRMSWALDLVCVSIVVGMLFSVAALSSAVTLKGKGGTAVAAVLLTLAILLHHFTAMGAVTILPNPTLVSSKLSLSPSVLAFAIAGVALSVLGMSLIGVLADRRLANRTDVFNEIIDELSRARRQVETSQTMLHVAINNMSQGLLLFDSSERIVVCNQRYIEMYGLCSDVVRPGCSFRDLICHRQETGSFVGDVDEYRRSLVRDLADGKRSELLFDTADGRSIRIVNQPLSDGGWVATHDDVTEQRQSEARIAYLAHHDMLTGLANRTAITQHIEDAAVRLRSGGQFSVMLLDLDRFKYVNDTLGHPAGDALLQRVALRLKACVSEAEMLGRLGGDEFAIILSAEAIDRTALGAIANQIIEVILKPFWIEGTEVNIGTCIGIAIAPEHASNPDQLLKMADLALYSAKSAGRSHYEFYDNEMNEVARARRELETQLRHAIQNDELKIFYQPIIDAQSCRVLALEALVRWHHPDKGIIPPDQFIPLAEEIGLIAQIGEWVLNTACAEAMQWPANVKVAVNLSPIQLRKNNLSLIVTDALFKSGLSPNRLELEITETALIELGQHCLPVMHHFKSLGIAIALDDFGTGYSSLSHLTVFPFDKIKIDKSFTQNITERDDCAAIISATLILAKSLGIETTAEGVETKDQFRFLRLAGVTYLQGYLFQSPAPAAEIDVAEIQDKAELTVQQEFWNAPREERAGLAFQAVAGTRRPAWLPLCQG